MCEKCNNDGREYTHVSDLSMVMVEAFQGTDGKDAPIILNDNAGDRYWKITGMLWNETLKVYELIFEWSEKWDSSDL